MHWQSMKKSTKREIELFCPLCLLSFKQSRYTCNMTREEIQNTIKNYLAQFPISKVGIFGSFARNEDRPDSDIDILVTFEEPISLFTLVRIHRELSELLNRKVDIVSEKYLHPRMKEAIEKDLKIIAA